MANIIYLGVSIDGFISDRNGDLDWLQLIPNPNNDDFGWANFIDNIDAIVMGRKTFETVLRFGGEWPYSKKVFVLSHNLKTPPENLIDRVEIIKGSPKDIIKTLNLNGYKSLYIDGGNVIKTFLEEDLIDEMILTRIPILLGGGTSLFGNLPKHLKFNHKSTEVYLNQLVMTKYVRIR